MAILYGPIAIFSHDNVSWFSHAKVSEFDMSDTEVRAMWPKFRISLTEKQTTELGRLAITWGQIDHFVLNSVTLLLAVDSAAGIAMLGDATTGPLVNLLRKSRHRIENTVIKEFTKQFCDDMGPLISKRNHIMHGIWGFYLPGKNPKKAKPGCLFLKNPDNPLFPDEITDLANKAAEQTHKIAEIWHHLADIEYPDGNPNFFFGPHKPNPPEGTTLIQIARPPKGQAT
ncbi:MAG: hypothetical protein H6907_11130 [Hyphomicrobiales bacterium]|nr:hypothetical protein [Hyphomicrobiales bacterium]MCP5372273.1 hypothetical protein [Hyphomicrobiales bacterium]